jgi:hypothetical protein
MGDVDDAAAAAVLTRSQRNSGTYNIVNENPSQISIWLPAYVRLVAASHRRELPRVSQGVYNCNAPARCFQCKSEA